MYDEILSSIDNIDDCVMEAELNVINAMINEYDKAIMIMENYNGDSYDCFDVFQESVIMEDGESRFKKIISAPVNLIKMLIDLIKKFVGICRDKIKTIKVNKAVSKAKQKMSDEELHEFTQRFGSGKIEFKNGDITILSDINIDLLRKNIDKFDIGKNEGYNDDIQKVFEKSEYPLQQYINDIDTLCSRLENEVIKEYEKYIKFWNSNFPDLDKVSMYDDPCKLKLEWIKSARDEWNKILIKIVSELTAVQKFTRQIMSDKKVQESLLNKNKSENWVKNNASLENNNDNTSIVSTLIMDIINGKLKSDQVHMIVSYLENKYGDDFFADYNVEKLPQEKWNEEYLETLKHKAMTGMTSKQFIYHLSEVSDFVHEHAKKKR